MNRENILKVADEIEKRLPNFDMIYPTSNFRGIVFSIFPVVSIIGYTNIAINLGLREGQMEELIFAKSYGADGLDTVNAGKELVPSALRWMVSNNDINWRRAFTAVMMDNAIGKDKT